MNSPNPTNPTNSTNSTNPIIFDITVVGAGIAGLTCAQQLKSAGYSVVILEKSRGVGGRCATRQVQGQSDLKIDHGVRYLNIQGELTQALIEQLRDSTITNSSKNFQLWTSEIHQYYLIQLWIRLK